MSENRIKSLVERCWTARKLKLVDPEGYFDVQGRWYPHAREAAGDCESITKPTKLNRYSLRQHCRTKHHVRVLVGRALAGLEVPEDIQYAVNPRGDAPDAPVVRGTKVQLPPGLTSSDVPKLMDEFVAFLRARGTLTQNGIQH